MRYWSNGAMRTDLWPSMIIGLLIGLAVIAAGVAIIVRNRPSGDFGVANWVTLVRLIGVGLVSGMLAQGLIGRWSDWQQWMLIMVSAVCLILDGVDGRLARARGLVSDFGARFDIETDAALVLILSLSVPLLGISGWWVILIGLMRYLYVGCALIWSWLKIPLPSSQLRKIIGTAQGIALLVALVPQWAGRPSLNGPTLVLAIAFGGLLWSFGRDALWQYRHHTRD